ncbi:hypothetical protein IV203_037591 [Nitzschia inconspicua]|uniref:Uncharacterized protein n=1 Tax=Nitzschia inconspicua TaxID=303405 RepID=A0A9K3LM67_9STRA|nr:hypothetical protein IV203_037591 [Nitzschia inconspicua]
MSSMRQRIPKATRPSPDRERQGKHLSTTSTSWEITSDDGLTDYGIVGTEAYNSSMGSIPMYNPLHYQSSDIPLPPSSILSWDTVMDAKNANKAHLFKTGDPLARCPPGQTLSGNFIGLRKNHLPSLVPAFIPDSRYRAYLSGRPKETPQSTFSKIGLAKLGAKFSMVAVIFLIFVGILIDTQPMYLPGIVPKHVLYTTGDRKPQVFYAVDISDRLDQAKTAYRAAFLYAITGCLCMGYAYNAHWWFKHRWQHYRDIPDNDSTVPTFHKGGSLDGSLPHLNYPNKPWNHRVWAIFDRFGNYLASIWPELQERRRNRRQRFAGSKDV